MIIHEYLYNDNNRTLYVEFSTEEDGDNFYRILRLTFEDIIYYSPQIMGEEDLDEIDEDFVIDLIREYGEENDLPEEQSL